MFFHFDLRKAIAAIALITLPIILFNLETSLKIIASPFVKTSHVFQGGLNLISNGVAETSNKYLNLISTKKLNKNLLLEVSKLKMEQVSYQEVKLENERLKKLLALKSSSTMKLTAATVVSEDLLSGSQTLTLNKGKKSSIAENMGVLGLNGIIGRTLKVSASKSQILILTNQFFVTEGRVQRSRQKIILEGSGDKFLVARHLSSDTDIQIGDLIVTSGATQLFPAGLPIGVVESVQSTNSGITKLAQVTPLADTFNTEEFFIILNSGEKEAL